MSFILDALRKSEHERKRNELPGLADARVQQKDKNRKLWVPLVALLLGLNFSLLIVMWLMGNQQAPQPAAPAAATTPAAPVINPPARAGRPASASAAALPRSLTDELEPAPAAAAGARGKPLPVSPEPPPAAAVEAPDKPAAGSSETRVPTLLELTLNGAINMAPLHLDIHVFSEQPQERFVFINMSKYREGQYISEGPLITEITSTGVIMKHQGRSFLLLRD